MARIPLLLSLVLFFSCGGTVSRPDIGPAPEPDGATTRARRDVAQPAPACALSLDPHGQLQVDGVATPLRSPSGSPKIDLGVFRVTPGVALVGPNPPLSPRFRYAPAGVLWRVDCAHPERSVTWFTEAGADFAHAVLSADGQRLWYSRFDGLGLLQLSSRVTTREEPAPPVEPRCASALNREAASRQRVFPRHLDPEGLTLWLASPCGHESGWRLSERILVQPDAPLVRELRRPHPLTALIADAGGTLWLADGGDCERLPVTRGALWRSQDLGERWTRVPVVAAGAVMAHGGAALLADRDHPGEIAALSAICEAGPSRSGGDLFLTADAGASWIRANPPPGDPDLDYGLGLSALWSPSGRLDELRVARRRGPDGALEVFASADRGASWRESDDRPPPKRAGWPSLTLDGQRLEADRFGLTRRLDAPQTAAPRERVRIFPPADWERRANPAGGRHARDLLDRVEVDWDQVDEATAALTRCRLYASEGRSAAALAACADAWRADPSDAAARYEAARIEVSRAELGRARALLTELRGLGGFEALTLLAGAPSDPALAPLRATPWFRALTAVEAPGPAFIERRAPGEAGVIDLVVGSDRHERLCTWLVEPSTGAGVRFLRVDCPSDALTDPVQIGDVSAADRWLQRHGIIAWRPLTDDLRRGKAATWLARRVDGATPAMIETMLQLFESPSGRLVALQAGQGASARRLIAPRKEILRQ